MTYAVYANPYQRADEDVSLYSTRQLDYVMAEVQRASYPELKGRVHVPVQFDGGAGSMSITQKSVDIRGKAAIKAVPDDDIPLVGLVGGAEQTQPVRSILMAYEVNFMEIRSAAQLGINVSSEKGLAAREFVAREENRITYLGDPLTGLNGLFQHPLMPSITSDIQFDDPNLDPVVALARMNLWANAVHDTITARTFQVNAVIMPSRVMTYMNTTYRNSSSDISLMDLFRKGNPHITFVDSCAEADIGGFGGSAAIVFYNKDLKHLAHWIPQEFEQLPEVFSGVSTKVVCHERSAGVFFKKMSAVRIDGVLS